MESEAVGQKDMNRLKRRLIQFGLIVFFFCVKVKRGILIDLSENVCYHSINQIKILGIDLEEDFQYDGRKQYY